MGRARPLLATLIALVALGTGCADEEATVSQEPAPPSSSAVAGDEPAALAVRADDIPVAHTPPGGWSEWPEPVLGACTEPLTGGAPDLRGLWRVVAVDTDGAPAPDHRAMGLVQRIEQCGDRLVVTAGGVVHDMRVDGTEANGVHDVAEMDKTTPITVVATYEDGVHVLRPVGLPIEVKRWRDGDAMAWQYLGFTARSERIGDPTDSPPG